MGLEALAILRGEAPVMNWSEPYHGTVRNVRIAQCIDGAGGPCHR